MATALGVDSCTQAADGLDGARWYDPTVGRWLSEDPSGLTVDADPYRYVGNDPTNGTDPSGLVDAEGMLATGGYVPPPFSTGWVTIGSGFDGKYEITYLENLHTLAESFIQNALVTAGQRVDTVIDVLKKYPCGVKKFAKQSLRPPSEFVRPGLPQLPITYLATQDGIDTMLGKLQKVSDALHSGKTTFEIESVQTGDAAAWVRESIGYVIHINPSFFKEPDAAHVLIHELGRFYAGEMGEDNSGALDDVYTWDTIITTVSTPGVITIIKKLDDGT